MLLCGAVVELEKLLVQEMRGHHSPMMLQLVVGGGWWVVGDR